MTEITEEQIRTWVNEYFDHEDILDITMAITCGKSFILNHIVDLLKRNDSMLEEIVGNYIDNIEPICKFLLELDIELLVEGIVKGRDYHNADEMMSDLEDDVGIDQEDADEVFCTECQYELIFTANYCPNCGHKLQEAASEDDRRII